MSSVVSCRAVGQGGEVLAILAPGQGAQAPGFLTPWLADEGFARRIAWASAVVGSDLGRLGTTGSEDEIRDTATCQPLLVAAALAAARMLADDEPDIWYAGHSVGELTAAALAGALSDEAALVLARERGAAMARAAAAEPTGMAAILGGAQEQVLGVVATAGLTVANHNRAGQVVVAGPLTLVDDLPVLLDGVARVIPLKVAGAFHTSYMTAARDALAGLAAAVPVRDPRAPVLSNADGTLVRSGADLVDRLVRQVAEPVRWDACLHTLAAASVTGMIELPPAGTLAALVRRELREVEVLALRTPDDLPAARRMLAEHRPVTAPTMEPAWRIVVAPAAGVFEPAPVQAVAAGARVGVVRGRRDEAPVVAPYGGTLVEWLVSAGDPVQPGQPLARLHPHPDSAHLDSA